MPLDQEIEYTLSVLAELGILDPVKGRPVEEVRGLMDQLSLVRAYGDTNVIEMDRGIPGPSGDLPIRIYTPIVTDDLMPAIIYFHGGGFVLGNLDSHGHVCRELSAEVGAKVISVDYRLAPEHPFPAAINDAYAALCWVAENASELNIDVDKIALAGDSAGANLAAVSAIRARDGNGPKINFQLLIYPPADLSRESKSRKENAEGYFLTSEMIDWFYDLYLPVGVTADHPWVSLSYAENLTNLPPTLVITAEYDPLRDEGETLACQLKQAGVDVELVRFDGAIHGFFGPATSIGRTALAMAADRLRTAAGIM